MRKALSILTLAAVLLLAVSAIAADRVVVVPLTRSAPSVTDSWVRVYDNNNVFIGYSASMNARKILSSNNYISGLRSEVNVSVEYSGASHYISQYFYYPNNSITADCSTPKHVLVPSPTVQTSFGAGVVITAKLDSNTYSLDHRTPVRLTEGQNYSRWTGSTCDQFSIEPGEDYYFYELLPHDPSVTGFLDPSSLTGPIKLQYSLPSTP